ncbi:hypothetical protein LCGC14_2011260 [marine sediment metagenome]|uniref:Uncharacterized protein n=1 Tax=marine sediment metagenome TaxID=412755 RepID=A0A0F9HXJ9_9ZZZZ
MRLEAAIPGACHHRPQENGFELCAVMGEMAMGLPEGRHDLRHLEAEYTVGIGQGRAMALGVALMPFGCMGPDLDALIGKSTSGAPGR